ncbi:MAG: MerR family DNA-binding transcriptional regulator [Oxalobacteraceae bacterium]|nr:MAG: MerR family DNA-binding transcriptional regulator [Oxalobacteraceae bacterium]
MKIGDVVRRTGLSASRIRFYERIELIPAASRTDNGYRDYSPEVLPLLRFVEQAQALGFTLKEIAGSQPSAGEHLVDCADAIALLKGKLQTVEALIVQAEARRERIIAMVHDLEIASRTKLDR